MKVIWKSAAKLSLRDVARYIKIHFGEKSVKEFRHKVSEQESLLLSFPDIGAPDPLFDDRSITYRSVLINGLSKMVYYIKGDTIRIAAFWDCRQDPTNQASQVSES
ncbi:MAG: type II toxin-antitoxin system RelE/ParE family toxin [Bacteroidales bacterium]|nr:type II toxin-antitoxin system RelE/ParE family toxin [Bacteroidales bacterium]